MAENLAEFYDLVRAPYITEKAMKNADFNNQYTFKVALDANKIQVRRAIERIYQVQVEKVRVINVPGKTRRFRGVPHRVPGWRKAVVTLAEGHRIELM